MKHNWKARLRAQEIQDHLMSSTLVFGEKDHDYDEKLTVWYEWSGIHTLYTLLLLRAGLYYLYDKALAKAAQSMFHKPEVVLWQGKHYPAVQDLRLGRNGYFPMDDEYMYDEPEELEGLVDALQDVLGDFVFSDEFDLCSVCGKVIRTSPDSYRWQPNFIQTEMDGNIHEDCLSEDDAQGYILSHFGQGIPDAVWKKVEGFTTVSRPDGHGVFEYEAGLDYGQDDDPEKLTEALNAELISVWYEYDNSQFYTTFRPVVMECDHDRAAEVLSKTSAYQGYSTAGELSQALQTGQSTEHFKVTTRNLTPEEFISGKWKEDDDE